MPFDFAYKVTSFWIGEVGESSTFIGVSFCKKMKKWRARANQNGKKIHLGYHVDETVAAMAYDNWAKDFADRPLNFREANMIKV